MRPAFLDYTLALMPAVLTIGGCNLAYWATGYLNCEKRGAKGHKSCLLGGLDITPLIEFGRWGLMFLIPVGIVLSIALCIRVAYVRDH